MKVAEQRYELSSKNFLLALRKPHIPQQAKIRCATDRSHLVDLEPVSFGVFQRWVKLSADEPTLI
jgi:hypothetical protein